MTEVGLVTKCSEFEQGWREIVHRMWPFAKTSCQDLFDDNDLTEEDVEGMDAGMLNSGFLLDQKVSPRNLAFVKSRGLCFAFRIPNRLHLRLAEGNLVRLIAAELLQATPS